VGVGVGVGLGVGVKQVYILKSSHPLDVSTILTITAEEPANNGVNSNVYDGGMDVEPDI
jgi:hypothetical protein